MPRYSPTDIKRSNRTLLIILVLLVGIIVAFIVAIATTNNDSTLIVTQEVNNLKRLQAQQALEDPVDSTMDDTTNTVAAAPTITTEKPKELPADAKEQAPKVTTTDKVETKAVEKAPEKVIDKPIAKPNTTLGKAIYEYTIVAGDNLSSISRRFHVYIADIKAANNMTTEALQLGKTLQMPITAMHTVAAGENISQLATKYGVKTENIKKANKLTNDNVALGTKLVIPLP